MSPPSSAGEPLVTAVAGENPNLWSFTWEAQSHSPILRLVLFKPSTFPSRQFIAIDLAIHLEQSALTVSFLEKDGLTEKSVRVPIPRVLIDPESHPSLMAFEDHFEVKLVLLLPVDHPLVSDFDSLVDLGKNNDEPRPLSVDSDLEKLSCMEEVHFYCRNCSSKLTKGLRCFKEMPSVNWREAADNWFGNCCCSFGGVSEKLVAEYAKSYTCATGVCLLSTASVLLCKDDLLGCEFLDLKTRQNFESHLNSLSDNCLNRGLTDKGCTEVQTSCCDKHNEGLLDIDEATKSPYRKSNNVANTGCETVQDFDDDCLSSTFTALQIRENKVFLDEESQSCDAGCCTRNTLETSSRVQMNRVDVELLENQKVLLDGYLGNGFMIRSSGLSKKIMWIKFLCPECSCLVGAYPCLEDNVPLDGGVRLFKCNISTSMSPSGSDDAFRNYTLERMFASQLLENAEDELSFRTIVRDMQTKSPVLQITLLNPNSWRCTGFLHPTEPTAKLVLYPCIKVLYIASSSGMEFDSRILEDWASKNQADEIYMFSPQILELTRVLELTNDLSPPSFNYLPH